MSVNCRSERRLRWKGTDYGSVKTKPICRGRIGPSPLQGQACCARRDYRGGREVTIPPTPRARARVCETKPIRRGPNGWKLLCRKRVMRRILDLPMMQNKPNLRGLRHLPALRFVGHAWGTARPRDAVAREAFPERFCCQGRGGPLPCGGDREVPRVPARPGGRGRPATRRSRAGARDLQGALV
jgi:hypothetical protein